MQGWRMLFALCLLVASTAVLTVLAAVSADAILAFGRPAQPLPLGTIQWDGEVGVTVDAVERADRLVFERTTLHAHGVFYIVHARILAPFGFRPEWRDEYAVVQTFTGHGGTMHDLRFTVDERAQTLLDRETRRPGPVHLVRGAQQHEDLIFDLPRNVEQPGIVFLPANDPSRLVFVLFGRFWQPHRFNLRYD
jgi:hypothetical protein